MILLIILILSVSHNPLCTCFPLHYYYTYLYYVNMCENDELERM